MTALLAAMPPLTTSTFDQPTDTGGARCAVDLSAVAANTRTLAARANRLMAVVKADAFGHGAAAVARTALANGADSLGVTSIAEALALRDAGLRAPILSWLNPVAADFGAAIRADVEVAVPSLAHLSAVAAAGGRPRVHLYVDCGLARDGASPEEWPLLCRRARALERAGLIEFVGVMGHLANADAGDPAANAAGRDRFAYADWVAHAWGLRPVLRHLAATSATLTDPETRHDLARVGAGLYGIDPTQGPSTQGRSTQEASTQGASGVALRGALTLSVGVSEVRSVRAGTPVGYGGQWRAPRDTRLATLPIGYADGIPRCSTGEVWLAHRRVPIVGRISMDQIVIDTGFTPVSPGDPVIIFGPGDAGEPTVAEWAAWSGTIPHEIVTGLGPRVVRS